MGRFEDEYGGAGIRWALAISLVANALTLWGLFAVPHVPVWIICPVTALGLFCSAMVYLRFVLTRCKELAERQRAAEQTQALIAATTPKPDPIRILLAEDGEDNQLLISTFLRQAGWEVAVAANGREAVRLALWQNFDLVLMDMQMPEMDGYQATSELRKTGFTKPIVALTADTAPTTRQQSLDAGCTEYLTKPIDRRELLASCRRFLEQRIANAQAADNQPDTLRSTLAGDPRIARVLAGFVSRLPQRVKQLADCITNDDVAGLKEAVHNLKGAGAGYGFESLSESAARVEHALRTNAGLEAVRQQVDELIQLIQRVEGYQEPAKNASPELVPA